MARIPLTPPERPDVIKGKRRNMQMNTETGSRLAPRNNFALPYQEGNAAIKMVDNVTKIANNLADKQTIDAAYDRGLRTQQDSESYVAKQGTPFTLAGTAFQKGANVAYVNSKTIELGKELKQIATDNPLNNDKFMAKAEEYKTKWSEDLPSNLQAALTEKFNNEQARLGTLIQTNLQLDERNTQINTHKEKYGLTMQKIKGAIETGNTIGLPEYFAELQSEYETFDSVYQVGSNNQNARAQVTQLTIAKAILEQEYKNSDTAGRIKIKNQLQNGTYTFGELGEEYASVIPGGLKFGVKDTTDLLDVIDKTDKVITDAFGDARGEMNKMLANTNKKISEAKTTRFVSFAEGPDGFEKTVIEQQQDAIDVDRLRELKYTETEIADILDKRAQAEAIGSITFRATVLSMPHSIGLITELENALTELESSNLSADEKIKSKALINKQIKAVEQIRKQKIEILSDPSKDIAAYVIENLGLEQDESLFSDEGLIAFRKRTEQYFNTPASLVNMMPLSVANTVTSNILGGANADEMINAVGNAKAQYPENFNNLIKKASRSSEEPQTDALLVAADVLDTDENTARLMFDAISQYNVNLEASGGKLPAGVDAGVDTWIKNTVGDIYKNGGAYFELTGAETDLGESHRAMYKVMFTKYFALHGDEEQAHRLTQEQMNKSFKTIDMPNGKQALFSNAMVKTKADEEQITSLVEDIMNNPARYSGITGANDGYEDFVNNTDQFIFVSKNGGIQVLDENGTQIMFQKLPSGADEYVYADMTVTPPGFRKAPAVYEDAEKTWVTELNLKTKEFEKNYDPLEFVETYDETGDGGFQRTKTVNEKMTDYTEHYLKTLPLENRKGYKDWMIGELDPDKAKIPELKAISIAMVNGDLQDWQLEWLGNNIDHLKELRNGYARKKILKIYKDSGLLQLPSNNDAPITMSPLQSLTVVVRDLTSDDYLEFRPAPTEIDPLQP